MINFDDIKINNTNDSIKETYSFRNYLRETYDKAEFVGDLTGRLLNTRMSAKLSGISVDVKSYEMSITDDDEKKRSKALKEISTEIKDFAKKFSYMSSLPDDKTDEFENWLDSHELFDTVQIGNTIKISL